MVLKHIYLFLVVACITHVQMSKGEQDGAELGAKIDANYTCINFS